MKCKVDVWIRHEKYEGEDTNYQYEKMKGL